MRNQLPRTHNPAAGHHRLVSERRFMYLRQDPKHTLRIKWQAVPVTCPVCAADTYLTLTLQQETDDQVQVFCAAGHTWPEPAITVGHFITYSRLHGYLQPHPDALWIIDAGFGEEPPPPIDYAAQITYAAKYGARYAKRRAKARIKSTVRTPVRKAKKKVLNVAFSPVAALLRGSWALRAGALPETEPVAKKGGERTGVGAPKTPSVAKYRAAYGLEPPAKGPACLVCEDTGVIAAPGIAIACTECEGPAAAAMTAAKRKAERVRNGTTSVRRKPAAQGRTAKGDRPARQAPRVDRTAAAGPDGARRAGARRREGGAP